MKSGKITITILIDALGWKYIKDNEFLKDILPYRKKATTILGYSCGIIPSILTGKYPNEHGRFALFYLKPETSPFKWVKNINFMPQFLLETRPVRKIIYHMAKKASKYKGYFHIYNIPVKNLPFFDLCEKEDLYQAGGVPHHQTIIDFVKAKGMRYKSYSYHSGSDRKIFKSVRQDLYSARYDFIFMYLAELDAVLHKNCAEKNIIHNTLRTYEKHIKDLYAVLQHEYSEVCLFLFSDHGMTLVKKSIDIIKLVESEGLHYGVDYIAMYDATMARFWFMNNDAKKLIEDSLTAVKEGHFLTEEEKNVYHISFKGKQYGESVFLMNPGVVIEPSYMGRTAPSGMHGFAPSDPDSYASFLSNRDYLKKIDTVLDFSSIIKEALR